MNKHELSLILAVAVIQGWVLYTFDHSAGFRHFGYLNERIKWRRAVGSEVFEPAERYAQSIPTGSA